MLICLDCWNTYDHETVKDFYGERHCPIRTCSGKVVDIDENLLLAIQTLNEKAYFTRNCCSGHVLESIRWGYLSAYVAFDPIVPRKEVEPPPKGWTIDDDDTSGAVIRFEVKDSNPLELQRAGFAAMKAVTAWADKLQERNILVEEVLKDSESSAGSDDESE